MSHKRAIFLLSRGIISAWSQAREREVWQGRKKDFNCYKGLVYNGVPKGDKFDNGDGVKKLFYWTYKFLVEKIKETDWKNIATLHDGTGSEHLYLYKVTKKNGQPRYIAWWDYFDEKAPSKTKTFTIDVGNVESIKITETIPNAEWGTELEVSDYPKFFKTEVKKVSNGKVSFEAGFRCASAAPDFAGYRCGFGKIMILRRLCRVCRGGCGRVRRRLDLG